MDKVTLPGTSLSVSRLCFGTMTFGKPVDADTAVEMVDRCIDAGINFFDTANAYQSGVSETMLGQAMRGRRHQHILATKVWARMGEGDDDAGLSRRAIVKAIEASLLRLQTDYVDLYYLHQPDYGVPVEESLEALDSLVQAGKVRYPATSNYSAWQITEMQGICRDRGLAAPLVSQSMYNLLARGIEQEFFPMATRFGISIVAYNPLAGGLLTGKHDSGRIAPGTRFDANKLYQDRYWHPEDFEAVAKLKVIAEQAGRSLVSLAFGWLLQRSEVASVILGASRIEQLIQNLDAAQEGPLGEDILAACDRVWNEFRGPVPDYNR